MDQRLACVYAIGDSDHLLNNVLDDCYIGVTIHTYSRWKQHTYSQYTIGKAIKKHGWNFEDNFKVIYQGPEEECYALEAKLRPQRMMGLNEAIGGNGGYTSYTEESNKKKSLALKGVNKTESHRASLSKSALDRQALVGANNPIAKHWLLVDPTGVEYILHGDLFEFCDKHILSVHALRNKLGETIGEISPKFRDHGKPESRIRRINTTGWTLFKIKGN